MSINDKHTHLFLGHAGTHACVQACPLAHVSQTNLGGGLTGGGLTNHDMNRFIPHVHRARPLNGFENGSNLAENTIEHVEISSAPENAIPSFCGNLAYVASLPP